MLKIFFAIVMVSFLIIGLTPVEANKYSNYSVEDQSDPQLISSLFEYDDEDEDWDEEDLTFTQAKKDKESKKKKKKKDKKKK